MKARAMSLEVRPFVVGAAGALLLLVGAGTARAQTPPPPPPPVVITAAGNGIGVGAAAFLSGVVGAAVDYDTPVWDIDAILGFADRSTGGPNSSSQTQIEAGVRGWYHLHHGSSSDFSLGGGIGIDHRTGGGGPNQTATLIEPGARARAFITSNVAVYAVVGLTLSLGDNLGGVGPTGENSGIGLGAQGLFSFGFTYYFH